MKKNLSIMIKPASGKCNLRCKYCFYHSISKEREISDFDFMNLSTVTNLLQKAVNFADGGDIYMVFQGGEPTLCGLEFYKGFVKIAKKLNYSGKFFYSLQTNGVLLDNEFAKFFHENNFLIGLSLDGDENANSLRVDGENKNSFNKIMKAKEVLESENVEFNIVSVVNSVNVKRIDKIYNFLKSNDIKHMQFIPCLKPFNEKGKFSISDKEFGQYLQTLFSLYYEDILSGNYISVRYFDNLVNLFTYNTVEQCGMNGFCSVQYVIEGNGNVYPCDFYCTDEHLLGNINAIDFSDMIPKIQTFIKPYKISKKCENCKYSYLCRAGGCKRYRENLEDFCRGYFEFFDKNIDKLENIKTKILKRL